MSSGIYFHSNIAFCLYTSWISQIHVDYCRIQRSLEEGDTEALNALVHEEFVFNPHVGGMTMGKSDIMQFAGSGHVTSENDRILFENEEVGVAHSIVHFANDSDSEAVLSFMRFKDGQIISMETGATPLSDNYKLVGQD